MTTTADGLPHSGLNLPGNQRVSSESEETDCDCWHKMPGNLQSLAFQPPRRWLPRAPIDA